MKRQLDRREFDSLVSKLGFETENTDHKLAWLEHDGKRIVRTRRSHGNKGAPAHPVAKQLHLTSVELFEVIGCSIDRDGYLGMLRERGKL